MEVYCYKLTITYDGTDYHGWQWQDNAHSVERVLKDTFLLVFHQKEVFFVGASRTDAGVHANGQVVRLKTTLGMNQDKMIEVWNNALPGDIVITHCESVDDTFHPQHGVAQKTYQYRVFTKRPSVQVQRFGHYFQYPLDYKKLADCLTVFVGTHDFKAFCKEDADKETVRTIDAIAFKPEPEQHSFVIEIVGKSFLRYMIRRIVGACLTAASLPSLKKEDLVSALRIKKTTKVLPTAPAKGLCLQKIEYGKTGINHE